MKYKNFFNLLGKGSATPRFTSSERPKTSCTRCFCSRTIKIIAFFIATLATLASCDPDTTCRLDTSVNARAIITYNSNNAKLHIVGSESDTVLYDSTNATTILLPLQQDDTITKYLITRQNTTDTLFITHNNRTHYISLACGCVIYHLIDSAWTTHHNVDSINLLNSAVETTEQDNFNIYLKP